MEQQAVIHGTFLIERNYPAAPDRVFAAFADPVRKRRWFAGEDDNHEVEGFEMDFRTGGAEKARFRFKEGTPFKGVAFQNDGVYLDIVPGRRVVLAYAMTMGEKRISASLATFEFRPSATGTDLLFTDQGAYFEGADGPAMREAGWRKLLDRAAECADQAKAAL